MYQLCKNKKEMPMKYIKPRLSDDKVTENDLFDLKRLNKSTSSFFWLKLFLFVFFGSFSYLNSRTVQDIPEVFSLKEIGFNENTVEKMTTRTKYSGDIIYNLSLSAQTEDNSYVRMEISIYDCISNDSAVHQLNHEIEEKRLAQHQLVKLDLSDFGINDAYSLYKIDEKPTGNLENTIFFLNKSRVVVIKLSNSLVLTKDNLITLCNLINVELV